MEYVVTIEAVKISTLENKVFYFSGGLGFTSSPSSTPANTFFDPRLNRPYEARRDLFDKLTTYGAINTGIGELSLNNTDGGLDYLCTDYAINGRDISVYITENPSNNFPADYTLVCKAKAHLAQASSTEVRVSLNDKMKLLDKPLLTTKYLGNNVLPYGTEGVEADLKDKKKPRVYGRVQNISPYFVNTARLIYQISDKPCSVTNVYSRGIPWLSDINFSSFADLNNDTLEPAQGKYRAYSGVEGTYIRLGSIPAGTLTCDAESSSTIPSSILREVLNDAGISSTDIVSSDFVAMSSYAYPCGVFVTDDTASLQVINEVAISIGAYCCFDRFGKFRVGRLELPTTASLTLYEDQFMNIELLSTSDTDEGVPAKTLTIEYSKNYTVQTDLGDTAASNRSSFAKLEYRKAVATSTSAASLYSSSPEITIPTLLLSQPDALLEANRRIGLLQHRRAYNVIVRVSQNIFNQIDIGGNVKIVCNRFGLNNGGTYRCIGMTYNFFLHELTLRLWG